MRTSANPTPPTSSTGNSSSQRGTGTCALSSPESTRRSTISCSSCRCTAELSMFSNRVKRNQAVNRFSRALEARKAAGAMLLDLTESNPTRSGFSYDGPAIFQALAQPGSLLYQPDPRGLPGARRAVAEYYRERGVHVEA